MFAKGEKGTLQEKFKFWIPDMFPPKIKVVSSVYAIFYLLFS